MADKFPEIAFEVFVGHLNMTKQHPNGTKSRGKVHCGGFGSGCF